MPRLLALVLAAVVIGLVAWLAVDGGPGEPERAAPELAGDLPIEASDGGALVGSASDGATPTASPTGELVVRGEVLGANDEPLGGLPVDVRLARPWSGGQSYQGTRVFWRSWIQNRARELARGRSEPEPPLRIGSAADGTFTFRTDIGGTYGFRAVVEAPRVSTTADATLFAEATRGKVRLRVLEGVDLGGRVVDAAGSPVAARVEAAWSTKGVGSWNGEAAASADQGRFHFPAVPRGSVWLTVVTSEASYENLRVVKTPTPGPITLTLPAGGAILAGTATDPQGLPVGGAALVLQLDVARGSEDPRGGKSPIRVQLGATADADGRVRIAGVPAGTITELQAAASGFRETQLFRGSAWPGVEVPADKTTPIDVTLYRGSTITGRVTAGDGGTPLEGASVTLYFKGWHPPQREDTTTDAEGRYAFKGLGAGTFFLLPAHPTHYCPEMAEALDPSGRLGGQQHTPARLTLEVGAKDAALERDLVLAPGGRITGRVVDPDGAGVGGARVHARNYSMQWLAMVWGVGTFQGESDITLAVSDDTGRFVVEGAPPRDEWILFPRCEGYAGQYGDPIDVKPGVETSGVELRLVKGCTLRGRVLGEDGKGLADRHVMVSGRTELRGRPSSKVTTDAEGAFEMTSLPAEELTLSVFRAAGETVRVKLTDLKPGEVREGVVLAFETGVDVAGTLSDASGKPLKRMSMHGQYRDTRAPHSVYATTDAKGAFRFKGIPPGKLQLYVFDAGKYVQVSEVLEAPSSGHRLTFEKTIQTTIRGTVLGPDGEPVPGCHVVARTQDGKQAFAGRRGRVTNGAFTVKIAGEPPFWITASRPTGRDGRALNLRFASVKVDDPSQPVTLRLVAGGELRGRVLDATGKPVADVRIQAGAQTTKSNARGAWQLVGLPDEELMVTARPPAPYMQPAGVSARAGDTDVVVRLTVGAMVTGRVIAPEGVRLSGASLTGTWTARTGRTGREQVRASPTGTFKLVGLPPGSVVDITVRPWSREEDEVHLAPASVKAVKAGTENVEIRLEAGVVLSGIVMRQDGEPVTTGRVQAIAREPAIGQGSAPIGADGRFRIRGLAPGMYELNVGDKSGMLVRTEAAAPTEGLRVEVPEQLSLRGRVVGERGEGPWIVLVSEADNGRPLQGAQSQLGKDGTWAFERVPASGKWRVRAYPQSGGDRYALSEPVDAGTVDLELEIKSGFRIEGRVERSGKPAQSCLVSATAPGWVSWTMCNAEGQFTLRGLPPGRYAITAAPFETTERATLKDVETGTTGLVLALE